MTDPVLELLRTRPDLAALATFPFDFDVERTEHVEDVHLASGAPLEAIAGTGGGDTYFLCEDGAVLYASSDGDAVLVAASVTEALEILVRLPDWAEDIEDIEDESDEEGLRAAVRAGDEEAKEMFAPELDAQRAELIRGLGLPERPLTELHARSKAAAARTEPAHLLLNSAELCAYRLDASLRQPLRDIVLAPGRAALERWRAGAGDADPGGADTRDASPRDEAPIPQARTRHEWAADPVLRTGILRAAQYDRRDGDFPALRLLLELELEAEGAATAPPGERFVERRLAAVLVGERGREEDVPRLRAFTYGQVASGPDAVEWARGEDRKWYGADIGAESPHTWIELARRQGLTEHARVELIRLLDDTGPYPDRLRELSRALERLGDHAQAARAQSHLLSLQDTAADRACEAYALARVERLKGDLDGAARALERARAAVNAGGTPPDGTVTDWHRRGLGRLLAEQHLELVLAAVDSGEADDLARTTMAHARLLLNTIGKESVKALGELPGRAKWAVAGLGRKPGGA
ncbi:hypothetical protein ACFYVL_34760 [Streptomyces sp. NPDC004111]|uniref:hypothetical protein n=1 Tax=Streptomyces sp. NPDC004111 TaxID=3364690 RepID=UPI0036C06395